VVEIQELFMIMSSLMVLLTHPVNNILLQTLMDKDPYAFQLIFAKIAQAHHQQLEMKDNRTAGLLSQKFTVLRKDMESGEQLR
jgi:hypothetical protein